MKKNKKILAVLFSTILILSMAMQTFADTKYFAPCQGELCATLDHSRASGYVNLELNMVKDSAGNNMYSGTVKAIIYYVKPDGEHVAYSEEVVAGTSENISAKIEKTFPGSTINAINVIATVNNMTISFTY